MKNQRLHELAKFAAGLVLGDLLAIMWLAGSGMLPISFLGVRVTSAMVLPTIIFDAALIIILIHYGWHVGKTPLMRERTYLLAAGTVFGLVTLAHVLRLFTSADVVILGWAVPLWLSWIGTAAAAYLSYMSFHLGLRMR